MSVNTSPAPSDALPQIDATAADTVSRKTGLKNQWLHDEVASRMAQRLPYIKQPPQRWIDWEPVTGGLGGMRLVQAVYPRAEVISVQPQNADMQRLVQARKQPWWQVWKRRQLSYSTSHEHGADMVWSNMRLHQHARPLELMKAWSQALNPQGFVMFSCLGPDSLKELREVYQQHAWPQPHHDFTDMHDWGDMLLQAGFSQPVMDMERITLTYQNANELLRDLRAWGRNLHPNRYAQLRTKAWRDELTKALATHLVSDKHQGQLAISFEIIHGHAFKAAPSMAVKPLTRVELSDMRQMLRSGPV